LRGIVAYESSLLLLQLIEILWICLRQLQIVVAAMQNDMNVILHSVSENIVGSKGYSIKLYGIFLEKI
jgi:hypothetical protein